MADKNGLRAPSLGPHPSLQPSPHRGEGWSVITYLRALSISRGVRDFLRRPRSGTVVATFTRSCYLDLDGRIITLVRPELLNGPLNILVDDPAESTFERLVPGTGVTTVHESVQIGDGISIAVDTATTWNAALMPWGRVDDVALQRNLERVKTILKADAPAESFAHHLPVLENPSPDPLPYLTSRARQALAGLRRGIQQSELTAVADSARRLAGLGIGLTPSGDDVLVGALIALTVWPDPQAQGLRQTIVASASGQTTRISTAYLDAAGRGEASEAWHRLLVVLPGREPACLAPAVRRVMAFGETSGADMLAGFLLAMEALTHGIAAKRR